MTLTRLLNEFIKERTDESRTLCNRQINICVGLLKSKRAYFSKLDNNILSYNRKFWKSVNPLLSERV